MTNTNRVEISLSKMKLTKFLFICFCFLIAGLWMIIKHPQVSNPFFNNPSIKNILAFGGILIGLAGIYLFTKKIFDKL